MINKILKIRISIKNNSKRIVFFSLFFSLISVSFVGAQGDLLDKAFDTAIKQQGLIDLGSTKDQVGNEVLRESTNVSINLNGGPIVSTSQRAPLIVRIAKLLLRITIVLAVTMVLYNGVLYIIQASKGEAPKDPQKNLLNIGIGILLSLASLGIINLINSITISSLKTSEDLGGLTIGCQTGGTIVAGSDLKEWICLHSTFGHPQDTMQFREFNANRIINVCKIRNTIDGDDDWKPITNSEMESKCLEDMGGTVVK
ncbi:MAG: hypothetical protein WAZ12_02125 [Candidatus Absconditicoccaceae bacterium]